MVDVTSINQLYSGQEKYVLLEVEVPAGRTGRTQDIGTVRVSYANMETRTTDDLSSAVAVRFTDSVEKVAKAEERDVMADAVMQIATLKNILAVDLRDKGKIAEAKTVLEETAKYLETKAEQLESVELGKYGALNRADADNLDEARWGARRKLMRNNQYRNVQQQAW